MNNLADDPLQTMTPNAQANSGGTGTPAHQPPESTAPERGPATFTGHPNDSSGTQIDMYRSPTPQDDLHRALWPSPERDTTPTADAVFQHHSQPQGQVFMRGLREVELGKEADLSTSHQSCSMAAPQHSEGHTGRRPLNWTRSEDAQIPVSFHQITSDQDLNFQLDPGAMIVPWGCHDEDMGGSFGSSGSLVNFNGTAANSQPNEAPTNSGECAFNGLDHSDTVPHTDIAPSQIFPKILEALTLPAGRNYFQEVTPTAEADILSFWNLYFDCFHEVRYGTPKPTSFSWLIESLHRDSRSCIALQRRSKPATLYCFARSLRLARATALALAGTNTRSEYLEDYVPSLRT